VEHGVEALDEGLRPWDRDDLPVPGGIDEGQDAGDTRVAGVEDDDAVANVEARALRRRVVEHEPVDGAARGERVRSRLHDALAVVQLLLGRVLLAPRGRGDALAVLGNVGDATRHWVLAGL